MDSEMFMGLGPGIQPRDRAELDSAFTSMVSYLPSSSINNYYENALMARELIGKLGTIGNSNPMVEVISPPCSSRSITIPTPVLGRPGMTGLNNNNNNNNLSSLADFSADPGFAERAARFSCFGSRSFNGRTNQISMTNPDIASGCGPGRLSRVFSSPNFMALGPVGRPDTDRSPYGSSVSDYRENGPKEINGLSPRKRKAAQKDRAKESGNAEKVVEGNEESNPKRFKPNESNGTEKAEEEDEKKVKDDQKSKVVEPSKDYIHVRVRRGQATDSHSLAERVRREKIGERMKLLQDLVPGCNKVIGKALMLDEIINYVQSLQRQVEFLSMKLASVDNETSMDMINMDGPISHKDMFKSNNSIQNPNPNPEMIPLDSLSIHGQNVPNVTIRNCSFVDPLMNIEACTRPSLDANLPPIKNLQYQNFCEGDLQTIVQMGLGQSCHQISAVSAPTFQRFSADLPDEIRAINHHYRHRRLLM